MTEERLVEMVAVGCERYCEARVLRSMSTKYSKSAVKRGLSATETHSVSGAMKVVENKRFGIPFSSEAFSSTTSH